MGQVTAAAPLLLVTVMIARVGSLEEAGRFTVVVGLSAAAYSMALWGLRTAILLDRFREFSPWDYLHARTLAIGLAVAVTVGGGWWMKLTVSLLSVVVFLRTTDALGDFVLAFLQVNRGTRFALDFYAAFHTVKLLFVFGALGMGFYLGGDYVALPLAMTTALFLGITLPMGLRELKLRSRPAGRAFSTNTLQILARARWYAAAVVLCSVLASSPRIVASWLYSSELLGVVGVSLSASTVFGMVFFTTWLRRLPEFETSDDRRRVLQGYLIEWAGVGLLLFLTAWFVLPAVVAFVFGFSEPPFIALARDVLSASVAFAGGMTLANLYKVTDRPWLESLVYLAPLLALAASLTALPGVPNMPLILVLGGSMMLLATIPAVLAVRYPRRQ